MLYNGKKVKIKLTYSRNKLSGNTMEKFMSNLVNNVATIVNHCYNKKTVEFSLSDYDMADMSPEEMNEIFA